MSTGDEKRSEPLAETPPAGDESKKAQPEQRLGEGRGSALRSGGVTAKRFYGLSVESLAQRFGLLFAWALAILVFSILRPTQFPTDNNFQTIFSSQAVLLVLAIAAIAPLIAGELDLSIAGVLGISVVLLGVLDVREGWPIGLAILVVLLIGFGVGLVNSLVVVVVGVDSIVATLGMGTLLAGAALGISSEPFAGVSSDLVDVVRFRLGGLQISFYVALLLCVVMWFTFEHTPVGRRLYFVGSGRSVARLSGIRVEMLRTGAFVTASTLSAAAGVMFAGLIGASDPTVGPTFLLPALAAAFLGATSVTPGRFNVWGTFIAVYFLVTGITGLGLIGLAGWISQVFYGGALVVAVVLSRLVGMRLRGARLRS